MIVFPLLYPEVFERFKIAPPRGVLFYGPPGTGKTLVARALANECSTGEKRVAFFMRKGADCLSKWVGESERQLRLLFDQAYQVRPSIIFFDEIDGLAPVRSSRQDQIHSSIVSTLLALMDGLDSRGEVVVIGATNRIDSIDPALRRPGRFDREFLFNLPPVEARADILRIHTKEWNPKLLDSFVYEVASKCNGYCGADMKALCTEAALHALRRRYPQIYTSNDKLQLDVTSIDISAADFHYAMSKIVPAGQRAVVAPGRPLSVVVKPLLKSQLDLLLGMLHSTFPFIASANTQTSGTLINTLLDAVDDDSNAACVTECKTKRKSKQGTETPTGPFLDFSVAAYSNPIVSRPRLLLYGDPSQGHSTHLAPALLHCMEKLPIHILDLPTLYANSARMPEESCAQVFREARRSTPSVIYIPHIDTWWQVLSDTMKATFLMMLNDLDPLMPILLLATSDTLSQAMLPPQVQQIFALHTTEQYKVQRPNSTEIRAFFEDLLIRQTCVPPPTKKQAARNLLEVLPKVPVSKPAELTEAEEKALWDQEEAVLRELRLFLRDMLNKLARDRKFNIFSKPVDDEEVPDYYEIIKTPMDLSTMMSKIDLHQYQTCKEFLDDIDLICANALEYNPATSTAGRAIRHRACALKDMTHALIDTELDQDFEKQCGEILESRRNRGKSPSKSAPKYYHTKPADAAASSSSNPMRYSRRLRREDAEESLIALETRKLLDQAQPYADAVKEMTRNVNRVSHDIMKEDHPSPAKKKRKRSRWAMGLTPARKFRRARKQESSEDDDDGEEEEKKDDEVDKTEQSAVNGDNSTEHKDNSGNVQLFEKQIDDEVPASELPVGNVSQAKVDLNEQFDKCDDAKSKDNSSQAGGQVSVEISNVQEPLNRDELSASTSTSSKDNNVTTSPRPAVREAELAKEVEHHKEADQVVAMETNTEAEETATEVVDKRAEDDSSPVIHETVLELDPATTQPIRLTRSMTHDPHVLSCMEIINESLPVFSINTTVLPALLDKAVSVGGHLTVTQLEKLYSLLAQKIYHHRMSYDRTALLQDLDEVLSGFSEVDND